MSIIAISGKLQSGKNLVGAIIQFLTEDKEEIEYLKTNNNTNFDIVQMYYKKQIKSNNYQIKAFADKLKDIVCLLIGCTREQLEDQEFKNKELGKEWWYYKRYILINNSQQLQILPYSEYGSRIVDGSNHPPLIKPTPRFLLQHIGTNLFRNQLHSNVWINATFADYEYHSLNVCSNPKKHNEYCLGDWIITDLRFPNELKAIKDRGGITIRVNRPQLIPRDFEHESETALDNARFDYTIHNDSDIEGLIKSVKAILKKEKII